MSILSDLKNIKSLSSSSLPSVINISNDNFKKISQAMYSFLTNIVYDETNNNMSLNKLFTQHIEINKTLQLLVNSNTMFSVDEYGKVYSKSFITESIAEMKRLRLREFPNYPAIGIDGEIIFTGDDFIGYILGRGWVSLTGGTGGGSNYADGWLGGILGFYSSPPTPTSYARYIVDWTTTATGDFAGHEGELAIWDYDTLTWSFYVPQEGAGLVDQTDSNAVWVSEGVSPTTWIKITIGDGILSYKNRNMPAENTLADGNLACNIGILETPFYSSDITVFINGVEVNVGTDCYFADPLIPGTPRMIGSVQLGDKLYWNGSVAGYQLVSTDKVTFLYLTKGLSGGGGGGTGFHNDLLGIDGGGGSPYTAWHLTEAEYLMLMSGGGTTYMNAAVMPQLVGGYLAGTSFPTPKTIQEMFDGLLYPYQEPAMTISNAIFTTYEVGEDLPSGLHTINYSVTNSTNIKIQPPDIGIQSTTITGATFTNANPINIAASGTFELNILPGTTKSVQGSDNVTLQGTNTQNNTFDNTKTVYWRHKRYWGVNPNSTIVDADILAFSNEFSTTRAKAYSINGGGNYLYYCYPASWGLATFTVGGFTVTFDLSVQSFTNSHGHTETYNVYRSLTVQFGTGINVVIS